jgi:hypothetical protein
MGLEFVVDLCRECYFRLGEIVDEEHGGLGFVELRLWLGYRMVMCFRLWHILSSSNPGAILYHQIHTRLPMLANQGLGFEICIVIWPSSETKGT